MKSSTWGDFYEDVPVRVLAAIRAAVENYERERQADSAPKEPAPPGDHPNYLCSCGGRLYPDPHRWKCAGCGAILGVDLRWPIDKEPAPEEPLPTPSDKEIVDRLIAIGKDPRAWHGVIDDMATLYEDAVRGRRERKGEPTCRRTLTSKQVLEELVYAWERGMEGATINWGAIIENARRALAAEGGRP